MAQLIPETLSDQIRDDPGRQAEVKVYDALARGLKGDWLVIHSVAYLGRHKTEGNLLDGEVDFLIAHKDLGCLVLEVKGGNPIERDGRAWYSHARSGERYEIKDPFLQAMTAKNLLIQALKEDRDFKDNLFGSFFGHAVCFPDTSALKGSLLFDEKRELILFEEDLGKIDGALREIFRFSKGNWISDETALKNLMSALKDRFASRAAAQRSGRDLAAQDQRRTLALTEHQYFLLTFLEKQKRVGIQGCPGSGKTLLALEKTRLAVEKGQRALLLCFNNPLGKHLYQRTGKQETLRTGTFHGVLLSLLTKQLGYESEAAKAFVFDDEALLEEVLDLELPVYDTIIVDEAQDFSETKLGILELMLKPGGEFCLFYDRNQNLIQNEFKLPSGFSEYTLDRNLRNSKAVGSYLSRWTPDYFSLDERVPDGLPTQILKAYRPGDVDHFLSRLANEIRGLKNRGFADEDITVISLASQSTSNLREFYLQGTSLSLFGEGEGGLTIDSVKRFKGLESPVVIITETERADPDSEEFRRKMASAVSRAISQVLILPDADHSDYFQGTL